jgi:hypothetical protein
MLERGSDWLERMRTAHCSSPVEYRRPPAVEAVIVNATFGRTEIELADEGGITINGHVWDFLILAEELGADPEPGDVIVANGRQYEVMALGDEIKGWRWSDPYRQTYRIHTKDIGAAT